MHLSRAVLGTVTGAAALSLLAGPALAQSSEDTASLSVLHGIPDLTVDVYVDGELTLDDFEPSELAGPLDLPEGTYSVVITAADAEDDSDPVLRPVDVAVEAGGNYTAAAHLDGEGEPTAAVLENDVSHTEAGEGRLTVRHVAAAPAVDVLAGDDAVITDLENGSEETLDLPAGTVSASVAAAGTTDAVLGPADVPVEDGTHTIVYAWGSLEDDTLDLATQTIDGLHSNPHGVPSGTAEVRETGAMTALAAGLAAAVVAGAAFGANRLLRRS